MLHSRWINGALAYWDTHQCRIIDALGANVTKYVNHFVTLPVDDTTIFPTEWKCITDNGTSAYSLPVSLTGGVVNLATGAVANNEVYMQLGGAICDTNAPWVISGAAGVANGYPVYFGVRCKALQHAAEAYFVGMAGEGAAAANFFNDGDGVIADDDFIGFNTLFATPDAWNITWKHLGGAVQAVTAAAVNAADWHIFEFYYDGATTVTFWIDGVASATQATTTAATFPHAAAMAPIFGCKDITGAGSHLQVDWVRVFQFN